MAQVQRAEAPAAGAGRPRVAGQARIAAALARQAPVWVPAAVMGVLGLWNLNRGAAMGNDEVASHWAASLPLGQLTHLLRNVDAVHGTYYLFLHAWMVLGSSPVTIRIPSVLAAVTAVTLTAIIARRLTRSALTALFAGLLLALIPAISYYAQTARSYALVLACVAGSTLALLAALDAEAGAARHTARRWLGYGALIVIGGYLNEMSLLVLAAHAVTALLARYGRPVLLRWARTAAVSVAIVIPLLAVSARETTAIDWIARPGLKDLITLFRDYFGTSLVVALILAACAVCAVVPDGEPWWRRGGVSLPSVAAPLLVLPGLFLITESRLAHPLYVDRYVLYGGVGAALLAGSGLRRAGAWLAEASGRRALAAAGVVVCLATFGLQFGHQRWLRTPGSRLFDFGGPSFYIGASARPGDGLLYYDPFYRKAELGYPAQYRQVTDIALARSPAVTGTFGGRDKPVATVIAAMGQRQRIWVLAPSARVRAGQWLPDPENMVLLRSFRLIAERHYRGLVVSLWQHD